MTFVNLNKPSPRKDQKLCDGCWKLFGQEYSMVEHEFKYLRTMHLCKDCEKMYGKDFNLKKRMGL